MIRQVKAPLALLLCALSHFATDLRAQGWEDVRLPFTDAVTGISFPTPDTGFVITAQGRVARTTDKAVTWHVTTISSGLVLEDVDFVNSRIGFVTARRGQIFRTTDGARTWTTYNVGDTTHWLGSIEMRDSLVGFAAGLYRNSQNPVNSVGYRTTDGGKSWKKQDGLGLGYADLVQSSGKLYLLSMGMMHVSSDFGRTWESRRTVDGKPGRALAIRGRNGFIGGMGGMRSYSTDSGASWVVIPSDSSATFIAAQLVDSNLGYLGGAPSRLYVTTQGGANWMRELPARQFDILAFELVGDRLYAVGANGGMVFKRVK